METRRVRGDERTIPPWRVLLIGGSSGVGKTLVARALARRYDRSIVLLDDLRLALQHVTTPQSHPALHYFSATPDVWLHTPEENRDARIAVSEAMWRAVAIVMTHHIVVEGTGAVIIEGDDLLPRMAAQRHFPDLNYFTGLTITDEVRAVIIHEPDEAAILANMRRRGRGFDELAEDVQEQVARASWLHGEWLRQEAERHGVPVVPSRPHQTLIERIAARTTQR